MSRLAYLLVFLFSLNGCTTLAFDNVWRAPDVTVPALGRTVVHAQLAGEADRRRAEDLLAQMMMPALDTTPAYTLNAPDDAALKAAAVRQGFGSLLVMKIIASREQTVYRTPPPVFYGPGWGWRAPFGYPYPYDPVVTERIRIVRVEMNLIALADDKLLWSGNTELADSASLDASVRALGDTTLKALVKAGLVP